MARVTIEDCLENVENHFKLVLLASKRTRQLSKMSEPLIERGKDKDTVVALREIAAGFINDENIDSFAIKNTYPLDISSPETFKNDQYKGK